MRVTNTQIVKLGKLLPSMQRRMLMLNHPPSILPLGHPATNNDRPLVGHDVTTRGLEASKRCPFWGRLEYPKAAVTLKTPRDFVDDLLYRWMPPRLRETLMSASRMGLRMDFTSHYASFGFLDAESKDDVARVEVYTQTLPVIDETMMAVMPRPQQVDEQEEREWVTWCRKQRKLEIGYHAARWLAIRAARVNTHGQAYQIWPALIDLLVAGTTTTQSPKPKRRVRMPDNTNGDLDWGTVHRARPLADEWLTTCQLCFPDEWHVYRRQSLLKNITAFTYNHNGEGF